MTETHAIPANLRGKEMAIPASYLFENTRTAGIRPNPYAPGDMNFAWHVHVARITYTPGIAWTASYPRFPRRVRVFMELGCGDRIRGHHHLLGTGGVGTPSATRAAGETMARFCQ
jgi:hypothetical protein